MDPHIHLDKLISSSLILKEDWDSLQAQQREAIGECADINGMLDLLVESSLITPYQANRVSIGKNWGLVLGNYRVLDRLGAGSIGVVYRAEHIRMRRQVAIKVVIAQREEESNQIRRFNAEMQVIAKLNHPNIVATYDAGEVPHPKQSSPLIHYYVMELLSGQTLEEYVQENGPLPPDAACEIILQIASALDEAHRHQLVHRDVKPANIMVAANLQAKLLDFGVVRQFSNRLTEHGAILGTVDYISPEQVDDPTDVDIRADIYSLGATFYWCLTGKQPFPRGSNVTAGLYKRLTQEPPSIRAIDPNLSPKLDAVVQRMMALKPDDRFQTPQSVIRTLSAFTLVRQPSANGVVESHSHQRDRENRVLIVSEEEVVRELCHHTLQSEDMECETAAGEADALLALNGSLFDLLLLDVPLSEISGLEVYQQLIGQARHASMGIVLLCDWKPTDEIGELLMSGADEAMTKPFSSLELQARIRKVLRFKRALDRSNRFAQDILKINTELESNLTSKEHDIVHAHKVFTLAMAELVERRQCDTGTHLERMSRYVRHLAESAAQLPQYAESIDAGFIEMLECSAPLHDIGMVSLPDYILMKPGQLTEEERLLMQAHTTIGAGALQRIAQQHKLAIGFLGMAIDIIRHHHERFDGGGYPDNLAGNGIPLAARIVALADVYDALRSYRTCKPPLSHHTAVRVISEDSNGQFDPGLIPVFRQVAPAFEEIFEECT